MRFARLQPIGTVLRKRPVLHADELLPFVRGESRIPEVTVVEPMRLEMRVDALLREAGNRRRQRDSNKKKRANWISCASAPKASGAKGIKSNGFDMRSPPCAIIDYRSPKFAIILPDGETYCSR